MIFSSSSYVLISNSSDFFSESQVLQSTLILLSSLWSSSQNSRYSPLAPWKPLRNACCPPQTRRAFARCLYNPHGTAWYSLRSPNLIFLCDRDVCLLYRLEKLVRTVAEGVLETSSKRYTLLLQGPLDIFLCAAVWRGRLEKSLISA